MAPFAPPLDPPLCGGTCHVRIDLLIRPRHRHTTHINNGSCHVLVRVPKSNLKHDPTSFKQAISSYRVVSCYRRTVQERLYKRARK